VNMQRMQRRAAQMMTTRLLHPRQMMRRHLRRRKPLWLKMASIRRCVSAASLSQLTQLLAEAFRCAHILEALLWVTSMTASVLVLCLRDKYTGPSNILISTEGWNFEVFTLHQNPRHWHHPLSKPYLELYLESILLHFLRNRFLRHRSGKSLENQGVIMHIQWEN